MLEKKDHGLCNTTSVGIWSRDMVTHEISERKLAVTQKSIERSMLNVTLKDKIRNEVIRSKTRVKDVTEEVYRMKGQ